MKLHVPTGPLPILPPYFQPHGLHLADPEEEIDLGGLFDRGERSDSLPDDVDEDFLDIDLADAFPRTPNPDAF